MSIPRKAEERGAPVHPGEFLREDFLLPLGLSANALSLALRVPVTRISEILRERPRDHSGYGTASRALLRDDAGFLDEDAGVLRFGSRQPCIHQTN